MSEQDYFNKDYYKVLGVPKEASDSEIKKAYRKLSKKYHPDVNPGDKAAEAKFKEITEANTVLSDKSERAKYDQIRAMSGGGPHFAGGYGGGGFSAEDLFGAFKGTDNLRFGGSGRGGFSSIFDMFTGGRSSADMSGGQFGGFGGGGYDNFGAAPQPEQPPKPEFDKTYKISLSNAIFGAKIKHKFADGSEVTLKIPAGTQDGKLLKVKSPAGKSEVIRLNVTIPDGSSLSDTDKESLKVLLKNLK